jgi:hypothetical protein
MSMPRGKAMATRESGRTPKAMRDEVVREPVGLRVQLKVRERAALEEQRRGLGGAGHLRLEQLMDAALVRELSRGVVESSQELLLLGWGEQRQAVDECGTVCNQAAQQGLPMAEVTLDAGAVEQGTGIAQAAGDAVAGLMQGQLQVELDGGGG